MTDEMLQSNASVSNSDVPDEPVTITDDVQNEVFSDQSIKHRAKVKEFICASLGADLPSRVSFRRFSRRKVQPNMDSVNVSVYSETEDENGKVTRSTIVENDKDGIEWLPTNTEAEYDIDGSYLEQPCNIEVVWKWLNGSTNRSAREWHLYYRASNFCYEYLDFNDEQRQLCNSIMNRFWGLYDNHYGNGMFNLTEEVQTNFDLDKIAHCMKIACRKINTFAYSTLNYVLGEDEPGEQYPDRWYMMLETQTLVELLTQVIYSYTEQPALNGVSGVAYADRSRYYDRWIQQKADLKADVEAMKPAFIRDHLDLTASSILVGGGIYGPGTGAYLSNRSIIALRSGALMGSFINVDTVVNTNF